MTNLFLELGLIVAVAGGLSIIATALRQPLIIAYIATGIIVAPFILGSERETMEVLSQIGVALLLFIVGLGLNPSVLKKIGRVAFLTGAIQIAFIGACAYVIGRFFGYDALPSLYIAAALAFSSTIIVVHILGERGQLERLHGSIAVGILLVQDIVAIFLLMAGTGAGLTAVDGQEIIMLAFRGIALLFVLAIIGVYVMPRVTRTIATSRELLFIVSLAWLFVVAGVFYTSGFSIEVGALLAGVTLSLSVYRFEIGARLRSIRDFFIILFFVLLGFSTDLSQVIEVWPIVVALLLLAIIIKPLIIMFVMGRLGYTRRTYFFTGISLAQISEFSFILLAQGVRGGAVPEELTTTITLVGIISIAASTYFMYYGERLYRVFGRVAGVFERADAPQELRETVAAPRFILFGHNRIGYAIVEYLRKRHLPTLVVDYDPAVVEHCEAQGVPVRYGDAGDDELLHSLPWQRVECIISTIPTEEVNMLLLQAGRRYHKGARVFVTSHDIDEALRLYKAGASFVIMPHFLGGTFLADLLARAKSDRHYVERMKRRGLAELRARKTLGHSHPRYVV